MTFSEKLTILRKKNGLSQEGLAEKLGVSRQAISRWELGATMPDAAKLLLLSDLFDVPIDQLLHDDQPICAGHIGEKEEKAPLAGEENLAPAREAQQAPAKKEKVKKDKPQKPKEGGHPLLILLMAVVLILPVVLGAVIGWMTADEIPQVQPQQGQQPAGTLCLSQQEIIFNVGSSRTLSASVENGTQSYVFQWNTSDKDVVSVKKDASAQDSCLLTAQGAGTATVTASIIDISKFKVVESVTCQVQVTDQQIAFSTDEVIISLDQGSTAGIQAVAPDGGEVTWQSEDETVATAADGVITAHKAGQVWLTARSGNVESRLLVKVYNSFFSLEKIKLLGADETAPIAVEGSISGEALWTSGDERVATVDSNGVVRGVRTGMTTITATSGTDGLSATCVVLVKAGGQLPTELAEGKKSTAASEPGKWFYLCESDQVSVSATPIMDNGVICADITSIGDGGSNFFYLRYQPDEIGDVIYKVTLYIYSDGANVPIQINGTDYELKAGINRIETEYTSYEPKDGNPYQIKWKGKGQFYVIPEFEEIRKIEKVVLSQETLTLNMTGNQTAVLTASIPGQSGGQFQWTSSNEKVATVEAGVVTARAEGSSMITVVCGDLQAKCLVTVEGSQPITGEELASGNKKAALETPGQWFYLRDGHCTLYSTPIVDEQGKLHLAVDSIDSADKKYVYLRYQPQKQAQYRVTVTITFAGEDGTNVDILGGNVGATPFTLYNGSNTVDFTFTSDGKTPFQLKFYGAGNYVMDITFREE